MNKRHELKLVSPIPLSVNHYLAVRVIYDKFKKKNVPVVYETSEAKKYKRDFKKYIIEQTKLQNWSLDNEGLKHIYCDCNFYFDRIDKDCNNYFKLLLDAITESNAVWKDDNIVCERVNSILYDSENPRIELTIYPVDYIGVFENEKVLNDFVNTKCINCKRYARNCSILKKAKSGRIQKEIQKNINEYSCMKFN